MMTSLSDIASDERTARMVLSMLVEPSDAVTGRILSSLGAVETLRLAEHDGAVVGLSPVNARVWRDHLSVPSAKELTARIDQMQQSGVRALIPGDSDWSTALDDLGEGAPYVLWTRGASSSETQWFLIDGLFSAGDATPTPSPAGNTSPDGQHPRQPS